MKAAALPEASVSGETSKEHSYNLSSGDSLSTEFDWPIYSSYGKVEKNHVWTVKPLGKEFLDGQVFDSDKALLSFSSKSNKGLDARHVRIIVR